MTTDKINQESEDALSVREIWEMFRANIWMFVISVILAMLCAVYYMMSATPMYQRTATVLIKDSEKGLAPSNGIGEISIFKNNVNVMNEIDIIKTPPLMTQVVERLDLTKNYSVGANNNLRSVPLYLNSPFTVELDSVLCQNNYFSFDLKFIDNKRFVLRDVVISSPVYDEPIELNQDVEWDFSKPMEGMLAGLTISSNLGRDVDEEMIERISERKFSFYNSSVKATMKRYLRALNVTLRSEDVTIADMSITDSSPIRAEHILNMLIAVYSEDWVRKKNTVMLSSSEFINKRLEIIQRELGSVDKEISDFKSDNLIPDVESVTKLQLDQVARLNQNLQFVMDQLSMAKYLQMNITNNDSMNQPLPLNMGLENSAIELQVKQYNEMLMEKNILVANSSENNPLVSDLLLSISTLRTLLNDSVDELVGSLGMQVKLIEDEIHKQKQMLASSPTQANELLSSERQRGVKEQLYLFLLQKREENELTQAFTAYNIEVLNYADGSSMPVSPVRNLIFLVALVLGVVVPVAIIIIRESLDTYIKGRSDLSIVKAPFLGTIPRIAELAKEQKRAGKTVNMPLIVGASNRSIANEAFRVVRTNLDFMRNYTNQAHVIQAVSFNPNSGKSFISLNLAVSMALKGEKVLVIDGDIRKGVLSNYVLESKRRSRKGLSEYLHEECELKDILLPKAIDDRVDFISVGICPPNPAELLLKNRLKELIDQVRKEYKYVFIDCPPVEIVSDSSIIAPYCDTTLFVLRAGVTDKRMLPELNNIYAAGKFNGMCVLVNDVQTRKGAGYYQDYKHGYYGAYETK